MKPAPTPNPHANRARAVLRPSTRPPGAAHDALDRPDVAPARPRRWRRRRTATARAPRARGSPDMSDVTEDAPRIRALITDDDPLVRRLIRDTLQADNMTVIAEATTGREAVELALFYRPDVVVMDYMMPEMDGIEATRRIHEQDDEIRVVLLTGSTDDVARDARPARRRRGLPVQGHGAVLAAARAARLARRRGGDLAPAGHAARPALPLGADRRHGPAARAKQADRPRVGGPRPAHRRRHDRRHRPPARALQRDRARRT